MPDEILSNVVGLAVRTNDDDVLEAAGRGAVDRAASLLFERYAGHVRRVLVRILGTADEVDDLRQDVFLRTLDRLHKVSSGAELKAFITSVTTFVARERIRSRRRRRWLRLVAPHELDHASADPQAHEAARAVYAILERMNDDDRIVFCLRVLDGMELVEVAAACKVSLATIKRRIARAEERFMMQARDDSALAGWVEGRTP